MPTLEITSPAIPVPRRRAIAVRLTRWLRDRGVRPAHVTVSFRERPANALFTGGLPVEALAPTTDGLHDASVSCHLGPDRDEAFRDALAAEIADALGCSPETPFLYIEFRTTSPADVYVASAGRVRRADQPVPSGRMQ